MIFWSIIDFIDLFVRLIIIYWFISSYLLILLIYFELFIDLLINL